MNAQTVRQNISCEFVSTVEAVVAVAVLPWLRAIIFVVAVQVVVWVLRVVVAEIALDFFDCQRWCIHKINVEQGDGLNRENAVSHLDRSWALYDSTKRVHLMEL